MTALTLGLTPAAQRAIIERIEGVTPEPGRVEDAAVVVPLAANEIDYDWQADRNVYPFATVVVWERTEGCYALYIDKDKCNGWVYFGNRFTAQSYVNGEGTYIGAFGAIKFTGEILTTNEMVERDLILPDDDDD